MARPIKNNADYFSHVNHMRNDERIKAVRRKYSHLGYAIWNMLLEILCHSQHFKVDFSDDNLEILAGDFDIEPEKLKDILCYFIKLKLIVLEDNLIFSKKMISDFESLLSRRKRVIVDINPKVSELMLTETPNYGINVDRNTHSRVEYSRVDNKEVSLLEKNKKIIFEKFNLKSESEFENYLKTPIENFKIMQNWINENTHEINNFKYPLTFEEFLKIYNIIPYDKNFYFKWSVEEIKLLIEKIDNNSEYRKFISLFMTLKHFHLNNTKK